MKTTTSIRASTAKAIAGQSPRRRRLIECLAPLLAARKGSHHSPERFAAMIY